LADLKKRGIVRPQFIDELVHLHRSEHAKYYGVMVWILMMLEQWFQAHEDAKVKA
jgi:asparagine synthase (glutamine-hydrolysing)